MAYVGPVYRWDIYRADLEPVVGSEQAGENRPVLVISNDEANLHLPIVTVIPLTKLEGKNRKWQPFEVKLPKGCVDNDYTPVALTHQVRSVSKFRLLERVGQLAGAYHRGRVEDAVLTHLGIDLENDEED